MGQSGKIAVSGDSAFAMFEENSSDNSDFEGFLEEDLVDNVSVVPDSDPGLSDIEVFSVKSGDISDIGDIDDVNDNDDLGEVQDGNANDQDDNTANTAQNLTWTTNFGDVVVDAF